MYYIEDWGRICTSMNCDNVAQSEALPAPCQVIVSANAYGRMDSSNYH